VQGEQSQDSPATANLSRSTKILASSCQRSFVKSSSTRLLLPFRWRSLAESGLNGTLIVVGGGGVAGLETASKQGLDYLWSLVGRRHAQDIVCTPRLVFSPYAYVDGVRRFISLMRRPLLDEGLEKI